MLLEKETSDAVCEEVHKKKSPSNDTRGKEKKKVAFAWSFLHLSQQVPSKYNLKKEIGVHVGFCFPSPFILLDFIVSLAFLFEL
jgi:hypothetical protein